MVARSPSSKSTSAFPTETLNILSRTKRRFLRSDRLPMPMTINQDICESNSHQNPPVLITDHVEASHRRCVPIQLDLDILQMLRIGKPLAQTRKHLPFVAQFALLTLIHEIIVQDPVESCSVTLN